MSDSSTISTPARKRGGAAIKIILFLLLIAVIGLFVWAEKERRKAVSQLEETNQKLEEIRKSTNRQGDAVAKEVINKIKAFYQLPTEPEPTVATIVDVDSLRKNNQFYNKAKNGDHLIITENRAILYDSQRNMIIDVVPVQINRDASPSPAASATPAASKAPTPTPVPSTTPTP